MTKQVLLVAGSRNFNDVVFMSKVLVPIIQEMGGEKNIIGRHGAADGADTQFDIYCKNVGIETDPIPAEWKRFGNKAGPIRNTSMAIKVPTPTRAVIFFKGERSKGSSNMLKQCKKFHIPVEIFGLPCIECVNHTVYDDNSFHCTKLDNTIILSPLTDGTNCQFFEEV